MSIRGVTVLAELRVRVSKSPVLRIKQRASRISSRKLTRIFRPVFSEWLFRNFISETTMKLCSN